MPSWLIDRFGSGVITERALKSTRLPIKLPRTRPVLPFSRSLTAFNGRPDLCATAATPGILLSTNVAT